MRGKNADSKNYEKEKGRVRRTRSYEREKDYKRRKKDGYITAVRWCETDKEGERKKEMWETIYYIQREGIFIVP